MKLLAFAVAEPAHRLIAAAAQEIIQRYHDVGDVFSAAALHEMKFSVARGYVRSKLGGSLRRDAAALTVPTQADAVSFREAVLDRALESLTQLSLGRLLKANRLLQDYRVEERRAA